MSQVLNFVIEKKAEAVKSELTAILAKEIQKPYVKITWENFVMTIKIEKMGTSEIKLTILENQGACTISESKRNIAMMHKPFVGEVEKMVDDIMLKKLGAKKA